MARDAQPLEGGLNTAVEYGDRTYHVQTQCSMREAPVIESLIYFGGQTLVRFTSSYEDIAEQFGFNGDDGRHLLQLQHDDLIRKVRHGLLRGYDDEPAEPGAATAPAERAAGEEPRLVDADGITVDPAEVDDPSVHELLRELGVAIDSAYSSRARQP